MAIEINDSNFAEVLNSGKPLVIDFWAPWCGPCKKIGPDVEALAETYADQINVGKCNVDDNDELAMKFGIRNIPTILFIKNGERIEINRSDVSIFYVNSLDSKSQQKVKRIAICSDGYLDDSFGEGFYDEATRLSRRLM